MSCCSPDHAAKNASKTQEQAPKQACCGGASEKRLDEALAQTFPASDPVSAEIPAPTRPEKKGCCSS